MGRGKDEEMERQGRVEVAIDLCLDVGAFTECDAHEGTYTDELEWSDAKELTNAILEQNPDAINHFESQQDMIDCVQRAMEHAGEECPTCAKNFDS